MDEDDDFLRRYTDLPALLFLLKNKKITILDPVSWDDRNDANYLSIYKKKNKLKCLLALCFTEVGETYHHWKIFAGGPSGVCIKFKRDQLIRKLSKVKGVTCSKMEYLTVEKCSSNEPTVDALPFIKRYGYQDECEFRILYESRTKKMKLKNIRVPLSIIEKITLSLWMPKNLKTSVKKTIKSIDGCNEIEVVRSSLISNEEWNYIGNNAVRKAR